MKSLIELGGVAIALLLASATGVLATDQAALSAAPERAAVSRPAAAGALPPIADILRGPYDYWPVRNNAIADVLRSPYEWHAQANPVADVLRDGYEVIGPQAGDLITTSPD